MKGDFIILIMLILLFIMIVVVFQINREGDVKYHNEIIDCHINLCEEFGMNYSGIEKINNEEKSFLEKGTPLLFPSEEIFVCIDNRGEVHSFRTNKCSKIIREEKWKIN